MQTPPLGSLRLRKTSGNTGLTLKLTLAAEKRAQRGGTRRPLTALHPGVPPAPRGCAAPPWTPGECPSAREGRGAEAVVRGGLLPQAGSGAPQGGADGAPAGGAAGAAGHQRSQEQTAGSQRATHWRPPATPLASHPPRTAPPSVAACFRNHRRESAQQWWIVRKYGNPDTQGRARDSVSSGKPPASVGAASPNGNTAPMQPPLTCALERATHDTIPRAPRQIEELQRRSLEQRDLKSLDAARASQLAELQASLVAARQEHRQLEAQMALVRQRAEEHAKLLKDEVRSAEEKVRRPALHYNQNQTKQKKINKLRFTGMKRKIVSTYEPKIMLTNSPA
eukprot:1180926-Prorocentrum_minimum.AAC.2